MLYKYPYCKMSSISQLNIRNVIIAVGSSLMFSLQMKQTFWFCLDGINSVAVKRSQDDEATCFPYATF